eukprot:Transcript_7530.p1 GENE.Transcript_7530~~Transcript_7530.p1  ORF type:complete len:183 (+),score=75.22 Transcript_7530:91-639(+)
MPSCATASASQPRSACARASTTSASRQPPTPHSTSSSQRASRLGGKGARSAAAARGAVAAWIRTERVHLTLSLMGAIKVGEASVETMCVINAAIVFFVIAEHRAEREALLAQVVAAARAAGDAPRVFEGFLKLLAFWGEVYCSHACERRFLEFSSGIPFANWQRAVDSLNVDLQRAVDASST